MKNTKARDFLVKVSSDLIHVRNPWHWPLVDGRVSSTFIRSLVEKKSGLLRKFSPALETPTKISPLKKVTRKALKEMLLKNNSTAACGHSSARKMREAVP